MDENTMNTIITKNLVWGALALACLMAGTCAFNNHDQAKASIAVEALKADEGKSTVDKAKAEADAAMFNAMSRGSKAQ